MRNLCSSRRRCRRVTMAGRGRTRAALRALDPTACARCPPATCSQVAASGFDMGNFQPSSTMPCTCKNVHRGVVRHLGGAQLNHDGGRGRGGVQVVDYHQMMRGAGHGGRGATMPPAEAAAGAHAAMCRERSRERPSARSPPYEPDGRAGARAGAPWPPQRLRTWRSRRAAQQHRRRHVAW